MADRFHSRRSAVLQRIGATADAILVSSLPNIRYLTGFTGSNALLLLSERASTLITDPRYESQVGLEVSSDVQVKIDSTSLWNSLWSSLQASAGVGDVAFESGDLRHRDFEVLVDEGERWSWRPTTDVVETERQSKDASELASLEAAADLACAALGRLLPRIKLGMTELAVAGILEMELRTLGSEGFPFPTIVAFGERSALPHARSSSRELRAGDLVLIDFGAIVDGYNSDVTRTFVAASASDRAREVHSLVASANEVASSQVQAGMTGRAADALARAVIDRGGFGAEFGHGLGHGIGLEVHEAPRLSRNADGVLPTGAVVTVEPGVYIPGWGGVRIEDDVHLGSGGPVLLTHFAHDLAIVG